MKKYLRLIMALAMSLVLAVGCSSIPTDSDDEPYGEGRETFLIGGIGPITGQLAEIGLGMKQGADIAIDEINKAGGVNVGGTTYNLKLAYEDDPTYPQGVASAFNALKDKGIDAYISIATIDECLEVNKLTYEDNILQIVNLASNEECTEYSNAFRLYFTYAAQGRQLADYVVNTLGVENIGVIYYSDNDYSQSLRESFEASAVEMGGKITASEATSEAEMDYETQLTAIKNSGAEIIFYPGLFQQANFLTQKAMEMDLEIPIIGGETLDGILTSAPDKTAVEGATFLTPFFIEDPAAANFVTVYKNTYGGEPDRFAVYGYDSIYVIKAAMEEAGSVRGEDLINAMTEITVDGISGTMSFTPEGEPNKQAKFVKVVNGKYVLIN